MEPRVKTVEFFQKSLLNELTELFGNIVTRTNARAYSFRSKPQKPALKNAILRVIGDVYVDHPYNFGLFLVLSGEVLSFWIEI